MKINFKALAKVIYPVVKIMVPQIQQAEDLVVGVKKGADRRASVLKAVRDGVPLFEDLTGKNIVNDPEWDAVMGDLNDVLVRVGHLAAKHEALQPASAADLGVPAGSTGE